MRGPVLGFDVGGANLKVARLLDGSVELYVRSFPLWREPHRLPEKLKEAERALGCARYMAVTMTAELADCFQTKREGVGFVLNAFVEAFPGADPQVFGVDGRFRSVEEARRSVNRVAAANWMASSLVVAQRIPNALFIDVGSTTTDIIPIVGGRVVAAARTDPGRLRSGELVYTGVLRTPVCAIVNSVPLRGRRCRVAAELFSIAADVHVWLGNIGEDEYTCETPDGRGPTREEAGARLARVVCADREMLDDAEITAIATHVADRQIRQITSGISQVARRLSIPPPLAILAGQGVFLGREAALRCGLCPEEAVGELSGRAALAAPAAAVAHLLLRQGDA